MPYVAYPNTVHAYSTKLVECNICHAAVIGPRNFEKTVISIYTVLYIPFISYVPVHKHALYIVLPLRFSP